MLSPVLDQLRNAYRSARADIATNGTDLLLHYSVFHSFAGRSCHDHARDFTTFRYAIRLGGNQNAAISQS